MAAENNRKRELEVEQSNERELEVGHASERPLDIKHASEHELDEQHTGERKLDLPPVVDAEDAAESSLATRAIDSVAQPAVDANVAESIVDPALEAHAAERVGEPALEAQAVADTAATNEDRSPSAVAGENASEGESPGESEVLEEEEGEEESRCVESEEEEEAAAETCSASEGETDSPTGASPATGSSTVAEPQTLYQVNIKCIDGTVSAIEVRSDLHVSELKDLISERLQVPPERQRLIFRGHAISNEDLVGQHITQSGQTIHMVQQQHAPFRAQLPTPVGQPDTGASGREATPAGVPPAGPPSATEDAVLPPGVNFRFLEGGQLGAGTPGQDLSQLLSVVLGGAGGLGNLTSVTSGTIPIIQGGNTADRAARSALSRALGVVGGGGGIDAVPGAAGATSSTNAPAPSLVAGTGRIGLSDLSWINTSQSVADGWLLGLLVMGLAATMPLFGVGAGPLETTNSTDTQGNVSEEVLMETNWHVLWTIGLYVICAMLGILTLCCGLRHLIWTPLASQPAGAAQAGRPIVNSPPQIAAAHLGGLAGAQQRLAAAMLMHATPELRRMPEQGGASASSGSAATPATPGALRTQSASPMRSSHRRVELPGDEPYPWPDLQRLQERLTHILERPVSQQPPLPPARMPLGETHAFLTALHRATSHLGLNIYDLQSTLAEDDGDRSPGDQLSQSCETFEAAARVLDGAAAAMRRAYAINGDASGTASSDADASLTTMLETLHGQMAAASLASLHGQMTQTSLEPGIAAETSGAEAQQSNA